MAVNKDLIEQTRELIQLLEQQKTIALMLGNMDTARANQAEIEKNNLIITTELKNNIKILDDDELKLLNNIEKTQKGINTELTKEQKLRKDIVSGIEELGKQLQVGWKFLMEQDKIIKSTVLSLGMSGTKADIMRGTFEQSAGFAARLGGNLEDINKIMQGYADETGRARALSSEMVNDIMKIGKGTGLGVEEATKLGAQFEIMGFDAKNTAEYVQGIVDTSERMGVNTTKVLKNLNDNFKKLNTFTFIKGSKAMAEMSMNAEKTKVSMSTALDVAEATRSLDKVIELGANLQVMGGEFAKMDPFQWLYTARNEPEKMTEKLSEMTRGLFTFKKMSDGTFEKFISPADRDRLASVAQSLGIAKEEIFQIAERRLELDKMNRDMAGMGLTKREKELVQGAAHFNKDSGKFQVNLAGTMRDISSLTSEQAQSFAKEQVLLEERAKQALTFDESFKATINILKASLLPLLRTINDILNFTVKPLADRAAKGGWSLAKAAGILILAGGIWKGIIWGLGLAAERFIKVGFGGGGDAKAATDSVTGKVPSGLAKAATDSVTGKVPSGLANMRKMQGQGARAAGIGKGIGTAAIGIGAGIGLAAAGISLLANAMSKLDVEKAKVLRDIVRTLGIAVGILPLIAVSIFAFSTAASAATGPLAAFGTAALTLGGAIALAGLGIGVAAAGIGVMGGGLAKLVTAGKDAGSSMFTLAGGILAIAGAITTFNLSGLGLPIFMGVMGAITIANVAAAAVANSFAKMGTAMSGTKDDWIAVQNAITAISSANFKGGGMIADLARLMKSPLKVQFADKDVALVTNVTLDVNGEKFLQAVGATAHVVHNYDRARGGKEVVTKVK